MCSSRSGLLLARRGARIKSIPSRRAKRRRTHRHQRQSKDRHRRAKRCRPAAQQAKKSRRKARNGHADSKSFHAVPTGRPPSGRTGGAAIAATPHTPRSRRKARNGHADSKSFHAVPTGRPRPAGRAAWQSQRRRTAAQQAATPIRKRPIQNPSMPCQRRGPRPARTGGTATRMRPPPKRQRKPFRPGRPIAARCKARAASRKTSVNRIAQVAPTGRWPALCESGPGRTEHRHFLHTSAVFAASCAAAKPVLLFKSC